MNFTLGPRGLFVPETPLSVVWKHNEECLLDKDGVGGTCPACTQDVKSRAETLYSSCVWVLAIVWSIGGVTDLVSCPDIRAEQARITGHAVQEKNDWTKGANRLRFWDLAESIKLPGEKDRQWRCRPFGKEFLFGRAKIHRVARTFNSQVLGYEGPLVDVHHIKKIHFDLQKFFRGEL